MCQLNILQYFMFLLLSLLKNFCTLGRLPVHVSPQLLICQVRNIYIYFLWRSQ